MLLDLSSHKWVLARTDSLLIFSSVMLSLSCEGFSSTLMYSSSSSSTLVAAMRESSPLVCECRAGGGGTGVASDVLSSSEGLCRLSHSHSTSAGRLEVVLFRNGVRACEERLNTLSVGSVSSSLIGGRLSPLMVSNIGTL